MSKNSHNALDNITFTDSICNEICFENPQKNQVSKKSSQELDKKSYVQQDTLVKVAAKSLCQTGLYDCKICCYVTKKKNDMIKHLKTKKHTLNVESNGFKNSCYNCKTCSKSFQKYNTFWAHNKKCQIKNKLPSFNDSDNITVKDVFDSINKNSIITHNDSRIDTYGDIISKLMVEMRQFMKETITEIAKTSSVTNTINGNVNNNNNKFNINVFLNEKCKDAMNLSDFLDSIVVTREDLENNARLGFVNGMTKIIMDNMKRLDILERSMHCTDFKRETMYIKDNDKWTKEENNEKLNSAIQKISNKSLKTLVDWREEHPDRSNYDSDFYKNCNVIIQNSMASSNRETYYPKIIKNIARETVINKNILTTS